MLSNFVSNIVQLYVQSNLLDNIGHSCWTWTRLHWTHKQHVQFKQLKDCPISI